MAGVAVHELAAAHDVEIAAAANSKAEQPSEMVECLVHPPSPSVADDNKERRGSRKLLFTIARHGQALRLILLALLTICLLALSQHPSLRASLTLTAMRTQMRTLSRDWPLLSLLAFVAAFCAGELIHVPGVLFIVLAVLTFGRWPGFFAAFVGALLSVTFTFLVVRAVGGQPIREGGWVRLASILKRMSQQPIAAVVVIRLLVWVAPPANYLLAMSQIRLRDYVVGSAIGLVPPVLVISLLTDLLLPYLEDVGK
jgi:uncharacterized membrane protein YdjX (TVP38/TMEM64 family)